MYYNIGFKGTLMQIHPRVVQFVYASTDIPLKRSRFILKDFTIDHSKIPYSMVKNTNAIIPLPKDKEVMDIFLSGKYLALHYKVVYKMAMLCQRSVWDESDDKEEEEDSDGYDSDQQRALYYKTLLLKNYWERMRNLMRIA